VLGKGQSGAVIEELEVGGGERLDLGTIQLEAAGP
jgi:hypothetical protein